jgi:hypothetical protein
MRLALGELLGKLLFPNLHLWHQPISSSASFIASWFVITLGFLEVVRVALVGTLVLFWQSKELLLLMVGKASYS